MDTKLWTLIVLVTLNCWVQFWSSISFVCFTPAPLNSIKQTFTLSSQKTVCGRYKAENIMAISLLLQSYKVARLLVQYFTLILILSRPQQQGIRDKLLWRWDRGRRIWRPDRTVPWAARPDTPRAWWVWPRRTWDTWGRVHIILIINLMDQSI